MYKKKFILIFLYWNQGPLKTNTSAGINLSFVLVHSKIFLRVLYGRGRPAFWSMCQTFCSEIQKLVTAAVFFWPALLHISHWLGLGHCVLVGVWERFPRWLLWECPVCGSTGSCSGSLPVPLPWPWATCLPWEPAVAMPRGFSAGWPVDLIRG